MTDSREGTNPQPESQESLAELQFTQIIRSPNTVVRTDSDALELGQTIVAPYGDNTIVVTDGIPEIEILDNKGKKIELSNNTTMVFDWPRYKVNSSGGKPHRYLKTGSKPMDETALVYSYTGNVRNFFEKYTSRLGVSIEAEKTPTGNYSYRVAIPDEPWQVDTSDMQDVILHVAQGFVMIRHQGTNQFIAFKTTNDAGTTVEPRNWRRVDGTDRYIDSSRMTSEMAKADQDLMHASALGKTRRYDIVVQKDDINFINKQGWSAKRSGDKMAGVGNNITVDPNNRNIAYYCTANNPSKIAYVNTETDTLKTESIDLPQAYTTIRNLKMDPSGEFFAFDADGTFVVISRTDGKEIGRIPNLYHGNLDQNGRVRGIDAAGHLVVHEIDFKATLQEIEKRKIAAISQRLVGDLFQSDDNTQAADVPDEFQHLLPVRSQLRTQFDTQLGAISNLDDIANVSKALDTLRIQLTSEGLSPEQVSFITQELENSIREKHHAMATPIVVQGISGITEKLGAGLTIRSISEIKDNLMKLKSLEAVVDDATRAQIRSLENRFNQESSELFLREGAVIASDVTALFAGAQAELQNMTSMPDFADWQEFHLPQLVSRLGTLAHDCPLEAHEIQDKILGARRQLQDLSRAYEERFQSEYAKIREQASNVLNQNLDLTRTDIGSFVERLRNKGFTDRTQAESFIRSSQSLDVLNTEIAQLTRNNPDAAKELERSLKAQIATVIAEIERGGRTTVAETGQQMILFGSTLFPKWEEKVKVKAQRQVEVTFITDESTKGPGITADKVIGDIGVVVTNSSGEKETRKLYEGIGNEDEWRYGSAMNKGEYIPSTYLTQADYRKVKQAFADWSQGDTSSIRKEYHDKKQALHDWYRQRQPIGQREETADQEWATKYKELLNDYATFAAKNNIAVLRRIDKLKAAPSTELPNGSGYVPEWQSHWTFDQTTENYLEQMAQAFKMQLDLQEGILDLKGHAGTGKDVLVKMFCNRTNRPYFSIDCTKWTTEYELSEDVILEAQNGASTTVKVPSVVLNGITTPGGVVYFNELTAMPEQAQIFLHALMDEKRTLTLKTSSGKAIRAEKSALLVSSRNPGYSGTFEPQFATKSRMVGLEIDYPPLYRERDPADPNPNPPLNPAEALRIARQVDSLADFTYDANPEHNQFVQIWEKNINGIKNNAPDITRAQQFDLEVILTLVQYANKLRDAFVLKFEKTSASALPKNALLVDQPITGREMRRCAYFLNRIPIDEKTTANPEAVARNLLERFFLTHVDKKEERERIKTAMSTWTSSKRPAA